MFPYHNVLPTGGLSFLALTWADAEGDLRYAAPLGVLEAFTGTALWPSISFCPALLSSTQLQGVEPTGLASVTCALIANLHLRFVSTLDLSQEVEKLSGLPLGTSL